MPTRQEVGSRDEIIVRRNREGGLLLLGQARAAGMYPKRVGAGRGNIGLRFTGPSVEDVPELLESFTFDGDGRRLIREGEDLGEKGLSSYYSYMRLKRTGVSGEDLFQKSTGQIKRSEELVVEGDAMVSRAAMSRKSIARRLAGISEF